MAAQEWRVEETRAGVYDLLHHRHPVANDLDGYEVLSEVRSRRIQRLDVELLNGLSRNVTPRGLQGMVSWD
jgi:hypothetical protein